MHKLEATHLRDNRYAVRPEGTLGTCGWIGGKAWTVIYVNASNPAEAIKKATKPAPPMHGYDVEVMDNQFEKSLLRVEARNRTSAASKAKKQGYVVCSVNMVG